MQTRKERLSQPLLTALPRVLPFAVSVVTVNRNFERQQRWTTLLLAPVQLGVTV